MNHFDFDWCLCLASGGHGLVRWLYCKTLLRTTHWGEKQRLIFSVEEYPESLFRNIPSALIFCLSFYFNQIKY